MMVKQKYQSSEIQLQTTEIQTPQYNLEKIEDRLEYKRAQKKYKIETAQAKNQQWENRCKKLDTYIGGRKSREWWRFLNDIRTEKREKVAVDTISAKQWKKHYKSLLIEKRPEYTTEKQNNILTEG